MKKFISLFLMALLPLCASAYEVMINGICYDIRYWGKEAAVTSRFDGYYYSGNLTIPDTVVAGDVICPVTTIGYEAFRNCESLTSVVIPNTVTTVEERAFDGCSSLLKPVYSDKLFAYMPVNSTGSYTIPDGIETIASYAFYGCDKLSSITLSNSVKNVGFQAFCKTNIKTLIVGTGMLEFDADSFREKQGTNYNSDYTYYSPIKTIWFTNTPPINYSAAKGKVNYVANSQFSGKEYKFLSSLFEVNGVKYVPISPSERTCDVIDCIYDNYIKDITIDSLVVYQGVAMKVKNIQSYAFYQNTNLKEASLNITGAISPYVFSGCSSLEAATLGNNITSIDSYAFQNCTELKRMNITNSVKVIGLGAFDGCKSMETVKMGDSLTIIGQSAFSGCESLASMNIGENLTKIGKSAFNDCSSLTSVRFPASLTSIDDKAFLKCTKLNTIIIEGRETPENDKISLGDWSANETMTTTYKFDVLIGSILSFDYYFSGAYYNDSFYISIDGDKKSYRDQGTFKKTFTKAGTATLTFSFSKYTSNAYVEVKSITIDGLTALSIGTNGSQPLFSDCPLDSVYIGRNISYNTDSDYGFSPFYRNETLRSVVITDKEKEISENEFYGCKNLQNVQIGDGVAEIGNRAFSGCASLKRFGFGTQVKAIGEEAFSDCTSLTAILSKAETPPVCGSQALDDVNKWECTLTVPEGSVESYQAADQWKEFFFVEVGDENGSTPIDPSGKKCATPTITFANGKLSFSCETDDVEYVFEVTNADVKKGQASEVTIDGLYKVSVYATKDGYIDSDVVTLEFTLGSDGDCDVNGDGTVDVADIATIIDEMAARARIQEALEE